MFTGREQERGKKGKKGQTIFRRRLEAAKPADFSRQTAQVAAAAAAAAGWWTVDSERGRTVGLIRRDVVK